MWLHGSSVDFDHEAWPFDSAVDTRWTHDGSRTNWRSNFGEKKRRTFRPRFWAFGAGRRPKRTYLNFARNQSGSRGRNWTVEAEKVSDRRRSKWKLIQYDEKLFSIKGFVTPWFHVDYHFVRLEQWTNDSRGCYQNSEAHVSCCVNLYCSHFDSGKTPFQIQYLEAGMITSSSFVLIKYTFHCQPVNQSVQASDSVRALCKSICTFLSINLSRWPAGPLRWRQFLRVFWQLWTAEEKWRDQLTQLLIP